MRSGITISCRGREPDGSLVVVGFTEEKCLGFFSTFVRRPPPCDGLSWLIDTVAFFFFFFFLSSLFSAQTLFHLEDYG